MTILDQADSVNRGVIARRSRFRSFALLLTAITFSLIGGYAVGVRSETGSVSGQIEPAVAQPAEAAIRLPEQYTLATTFGDIGPQLLDAGAIDFDRFVQIYDRAGQPLSDEHLRILSEGGDIPIGIDKESAYFLLNLFWAFGLTNQNLILEEGPLAQYSEGRIDVFASTGGWTVGSLPIDELYSSVPLVRLTSQQQARLEEVAYAVFRPCCNNHTAFADCNHGMAMLGLLELMAAQDATVDEMFEAAKHFNAFWFPQQTAELATFFYATQGWDFAEIDTREAVGRNYFSSAGYQAVHQWLGANNLLEQPPRGGTSCGV
ncbi:MAG: hypothetical protein K8L99_20165 [Anaerolineae bacterium]|nr:hypothetical protein [Anaerolineae bacterium]